MVLRISWTAEPRRVRAVTYRREFDSRNFGSVQTRPGDEKLGLIALLRLARGETGS